MDRSAIDEEEEKERLHILPLSKDFRSEKLWGCEGLFIKWFIAFMVILGNEIPVQALRFQEISVPDFKTIDTLRLHLPTTISLVLIYVRG